jgi:hypothetical protein
LQAVKKRATKRKSSEFTESADDDLSPQEMKSPRRTPRKVVKVTNPAAKKVVRAKRPTTNGTSSPGDDGKSDQKYVKALPKAYKAPKKPSPAKGTLNIFLLLLPI